MRNAKLHHVGFVVSSISKEIEGFKAALQATWGGEIFFDPLQKVRVTFIQTANPADAQIELVEPAAEDSPVNNFLKKRGGMHHLCYEVPDLEQALEEARAAKGLVVKSPNPAVAFQGRRIAWVMTAQRLLLEYLEQNPR